MENKEEYLNRLIDKKIKDYLKIFGAVNIEGPKWCGKTWAGLHQAKTIISLDKKEIKAKVELDMAYVLDKEPPVLIDEWNLVPEIWDEVRRRCDETSNKSKYILTRSTKYLKEEDEIFHSGAGRIGTIKMYTMSLYESKISKGEASLTDMLNNNQKNVILKEKLSLEQIANLIIRGGWPLNRETPNNLISAMPKSYINSILDKDTNSKEKKYDKNKMSILLKSLSRNESSIVSTKTILDDISESGENSIQSRNTLEDYIDFLERLHLIENQPAYSDNYRSPERLGKSPKRHLTDPSLSCACLNLTSEKLIEDLNTFGFMFEALVERDLRIYMDYLDGTLYHFRDNVTGLEVDSILEFPGGDYAAVEIKLGFNKVDEAKKSLMKFYNSMTKKPKFMCIIVGIGDIIAKDPETGIYILPITTLKP